MRKFVLTSESQGDNFIGRIKTGGMGATYEKIAGESTILGGGFCKPMQSSFVWYPDKFRINLPSFRYLFDKLIIEHQGEFSDTTNRILFAYDQRDPLQVMEIDYPIEMYNVHPPVRKYMPGNNLYGQGIIVNDDMLHRLREAMDGIHAVPRGVVDPEYNAPGDQEPDDEGPDVEDLIPHMAEDAAVPPEQVVRAEPVRVDPFDDLAFWNEMINRDRRA